MYDPIDEIARLSEEVVSRRIGDQKRRKAAMKVAQKNAKLRELVPKMARALGVGTGWCYSTCSHEFMCDPAKECPIEKVMAELGIEVKE